MEDLFRSYWWLLFPLGFFVFSAWDQWMRYLRHRETLDLIKTFAAQGKEVPPELLRRATREDDDDDDGFSATVETSHENRASRRYRRRYRRERGWYQVVLFGVMAAGFGYAAYTDIYGAGEAFVIVTFVMSALCLASLVSTLTARRD